MPPTLVILAAGLGSRYGGLKQIDPIGPSGEIIIDYSIYDAIRAGFEKVVFVINHDIEASFKQKIGEKYRSHIDIEYTFQEIEDLPTGFSVPSEREKPWGTAHALLCASPAVNEPFVVINADDFYGPSAYQLIADALHPEDSADSPGEEYYMCGFTLRNTLSRHGTVSRGICSVDDNDFLQDIAEVKKIGLEREGESVFRETSDGRHPMQGNEITSMNFWGLTPSVFEPLREQFREFLRQHRNSPKTEFYLPTLVKQLVDQQRVQVKVLRSNDSWFGITYPEDKPEVQKGIHQLTEQGIYPTPLF